MKIFSVMTMMEPITITRNATAIRNIELRRGLMIIHMIKLKIRFSGGRVFSGRGGEGQA